jgi:hypothetical protein
MGLAIHWSAPELNLLRIWTRSRGAHNKDSLLGQSYVPYQQPTECRHRKLKFSTSTVICEDKPLTAPKNSTSSFP